MEITIEDFKSWLSKQDKEALENFLINFGGRCDKITLEEYLLKDVWLMIGGKISGAFTWSLTPQGITYWANIDTQWRDYVKRNNITKIIKMETKSVKIDIPEGYEIDKEKSTFENIVFKKIEQKFSKSWEEFCKNNIITEGEACISDFSDIIKASKGGRDSDIDKNVIPSKFVEPMLALMQLLTIREKEYTKGWEPTYNGWNDIPTIWNTGGTIIAGRTLTNRRILTFPTDTLRDEFFKNWESLINLAKPLL